MQFVVITLWIYALNVKHQDPRHQRTVLWRGVFVITPSIFTVYPGGSKHDKFVRSTIGNGNSKNTGNEWRQIMMDWIYGLVDFNDFIDRLVISDPCTLTSN